MPCLEENVIRECDGWIIGCTEAPELVRFLIVFGTSRILLNQRCAEVGRRLRVPGNAVIPYHTMPCHAQNISE